MNEEQKKQLIAEAENVEAIRDLLNEYYTVSDLFEAAANAGSILLNLVHINAISQDDLMHIMVLLDQHVMLANLLKPFQGKDGEV